MPMRPAVRCKAKNCIELVHPPKRFCDEHQKEIWIKEKQNKKYKSKVTNLFYSSDPFYKSKAWINLRNFFISKNPACKLCGQEGVVVDHIKAIKMGGHKFDMANLQTLCRKCDQMKRGKESHEYLKIKAK